MLFKSKPKKTLIAKNEKFSVYVYKSFQQNVIVIDCPFLPSIRNNNFEYIKMVEKYFTDIIEKVKENTNYTFYYGSIIYYRKGNKLADNDNTFLSEFINIMKRKRLISDDLATSFSIINVADKCENDNLNKLIIINKNRKPFDNNLKKLLNL